MTCYYVLRSFTTGILKSVSIDDSVKKNIVAFFMHKNEGESVYAFKGANDAVGVLLLEFADKDEMRGFYKEADKNIMVLIQ